MTIEFNFDDIATERERLALALPHLAALIEVCDPNADFSSAQASWLAFKAAQRAAAKWDETEGVPYLKYVEMLVRLSFDDARKEGRFISPSEKAEDIVNAAAATLKGGVSK